MRPYPAVPSRNDLRTIITAWALLPWTLPAALLLLSTISQIQTPETQSLLAGSVSWAFVLVQSSLRVGFLAKSDQIRRKRLCWAAGGLFALAQVCERAALDREGIWRAKALLPGTLFGLIQIDFGPGAKPASTSHTEDQFVTGPLTPGLTRIVLIATVSAAVALNTPFVTAPTYALGLCSVLLISFAIVFLELALTIAADDRFGATGGLVAANGAHSRRTSSAAVQREAYWFCIRDFAAVATLAFIIASLAFQDFRIGGLAWDVVRGGSSGFRDRKSVV